MKTILEAAKDYILGNRQGCPSTSESEDTDIFIAGVNFAQQWIPVEDELPKPITSNTNVSRQILIKLKDGGYRVMQYDHVREEFFPHYVNETITHWRKIELK